MIGKLVYLDSVKVDEFEYLQLDFDRSVPCPSYAEHTSCSNSHFEGNAKNGLRFVFTFKKHVIQIELTKSEAKELFKDMRIVMKELEIP